MMHIIGIGLETKDISLKGIEALRKCRKAYLEDYTSDLPYRIKELEKVIKKKVILVGRNFVEDGNALLEESKKFNIALLSYGDPLSTLLKYSLLLQNQGYSYTNSAKLLLFQNFIQISSQKVFMMS